MFQYQPFNALHIICLVLVYALCLFAYIYGDRIAFIKNKNFDKIVCLAIFLVWFIFKIANAVVFFIGTKASIPPEILSQIGEDNLNSQLTTNYIQTQLPLFACDIFAIFALIYVFWKNDFIFKCVICWGILQGIFAVWFPDAIPGSNIIITVSIMLNYGFGFAFAIIKITRHKLQITMKDICNLVIAVTAIGVVSFIANSIIKGANYMWLSSSGDPSYPFMKPMLTFFNNDIIYAIFSLIIFMVPIPLIPLFAKGLSLLENKINSPEDK